MLIKCGVDLGYVDKNGNNALHIACQGGHTDVVRKILYYFDKCNRLKKKKKKSFEPKSKGTSPEVFKDKL